MVFGETMAPARWVGFAIVWLALAILSIDSLRASRRARADARPDAGADPLPV